MFATSCDLVYDREVAACFVNRWLPVFMPERQAVLMVTGLRRMVDTALESCNMLSSGHGMTGSSLSFITEARHLMASICGLVVEHQRGTDKFGMPIEGLEYLSNDTREVSESAFKKATTEKPSKSKK